MSVIDAASSTVVTTVALGPVEGFPAGGGHADGDTAYVANPFVGTGTVVRLDEAGFVGNKSRCGAVGTSDNLSVSDSTQI